MKPIICLFAFLLGISFNSSGQNSRPLTDEGAILMLETFMQAQLTNNIAVLKKVLANDVVIYIPGKIDPVKVSKADYLSFLEQVGVMEQKCYSSFEVFDSRGVSLTARIDFAYPDFIVKHFVKAEKKSGQWKITELKKVMDSGSLPVTVLLQ